MILRQLNESKPFIYVPREIGKTFFEMGMIFYNVKVAHFDWQLIDFWFLNVPLGRWRDFARRASDTGE